MTGSGEPSFAGSGPWGGAAAGCTAQIRADDPAHLAAIRTAYGRRAQALVAIDLEGTAHLAVGRLPTGMGGARLLELLESPDLWADMAPGPPAAGHRLAHLLPEIPAADAGELRLFRDAEGARGALLLAEPPAAADAALGPEREASGDALVDRMLREWLALRAAGALQGFLKALIGAVAQGVLALDAEGRLVYLNALGGEILGVEPQDVLGQDCTRLLRPAVGEQHPLLEGLAGRVTRIDLYVTDGRGRDVPLALQMARSVDPSAEPAGLICLFRDLSEERAFDQETQRRERLAVIGELAAGVAHEIRNPLTGIANCAQVLQMRLAEDERNRKMADLVLRETQRLDRIVTSLLGFARPGPPRMRATVVEELLRSALEVEQPVCEKQGVHCRLRVAGRIPTIYVDPEQIQQVLANLLRNARQAMPDGGELTLEIEVVRRPRHQRRRSMGRRTSDRIRVHGTAPLARFVRLRVRDTGAGISEEKVGRIFDPFFTTRSEGTGLGLSVSQSIIQEHGGSISVHSVCGKGTTFDVDLPVERREGGRRADPA